MDLFEFYRTIERAIFFIIGVAFAYSITKYGWKTDLVIIWFITLCVCHFVAVWIDKRISYVETDYFLGH
jgi:hypothetical protein